MMSDFGEEVQTEGATMSYDPDSRCANPTGDVSCMQRLEVVFAIPTYMTTRQQQKLLSVVEEIVRNPENEPLDGVHWVMEVGDKYLPEEGEPTFDEATFYIGTAARGFVTAEERARTLQEREDRKPGEFTCPKCGGHNFGSSRDVAADQLGTADRPWTRYCNGRGQRVKFFEGRMVPIEGENEPQVRCDFTWPEEDDRKYGLKPPYVAEHQGVVPSQQSFQDLMRSLLQIKQELALELANLKSRADSEIEYFVKGKIYVYENTVKQLERVVERAAGGVAPLQE